MLYYNQKEKEREAISMTKTTIDKEAIIEELRKQDEQLRVIFERRKELAKIARKEGYLSEIWKKLF